MTTAQDIIDQLDLAPHPEGGYYRRTYCNEEGPQDRGHASAIYYLIEQQSFALWHRVDADELWFWHAGAPALIETGAGPDADDSHLIGPNIVKGERPQLIIPSNVWQRVKSTGDWSLVSCVVSPGFLFETFEMHVESRPSDE